MLSAHRDSIFSSSLVSISTQQLEAKKAMQAMESKLEQDAHIVVKTLKEQSNNAFPALAISAMESMLKSHIKESFRESCQELESKMAEHQESLASNKESIHEESSEQFWDSFPTTPKEEMSSSKPDFPPFQSDPSPIRDEAPSRHQRSVTTSTRISCHKSYTTLFGRIDINVSAIGRTVSRFGTERTDTEQIFNATFTFRPSPWISHPVVWQIAVRKDTSSTGSRLNIVPTYRPIVSHKSPILQACQYGDEQKVQDLLGSCQASISDVDEWGRGLMHVSLKPFESLCSAERLTSKDGCKVTKHRSDANPGRARLCQGRGRQFWQVRQLRIFLSHLSVPANVIDNMLSHHLKLSTRHDYIL